MVKHFERMVEPISHTNSMVIIVFLCGGLIDSEFRIRFKRFVVWLKKFVETKDQIFRNEMLKFNLLRTNAYKTELVTKRIQIYFIQRFKMIKYEL